MRWQQKVRQSMGVRMRKKKKIFTALSVIAAFILIAGAIVLFVLYSSSSRALINKTEIQEFQTSASDFKVAVISDTQLPLRKSCLQKTIHTL